VSEPLQKLSRALRARRETLGMSQLEVGLRVGMDQSQYGKIERGELDVRFRTLVRVTTALETTPADLLQCF
jgi:transcriptional regulator with XRE-family HTH domain